MGVLTDAFVASEADLDSLQPGEGGPSARFPTVEGKSIDPLKLATLEAILRGQETYTYVASIQEPLQDWGEQFVCRFPDTLVAALAQLQPSNMLQVAAAWAATEEWQLDNPTSEAISGLADLIASYSDLAQRAQRESKSMYMWICL